MRQSQSLANGLYRWALVDALDPLALLLTSVGSIRHDAAAVHLVISPLALICVLVGVSVGTIACALPVNPATFIRIPIGVLRKALSMGISRLAPFTFVVKFGVGPIAVRFTAVIFASCSSVAFRAFFLAFCDCTSRLRFSAG